MSTTDKAKSKLFLNRLERLYKDRDRLIEEIAKYERLIEEINPQLSCVNSVISELEWNRNELEFAPKDGER